MTAPIPFIDLAAQQSPIRDRIEAAIRRVLDHGNYIMGPEVAELERRLGEFAGMAETLSCGSGTDALALPLMAWGIKPGDAVFCPAFTFAATAEVVAWLGASPVFVDILPDTFNMDPASLARAVAEVKATGRLNPAAVIAVDLFGQMADYPAIKGICEEHGLKLIADAAQGYGATLNGQMASAYADVVATSFFPAKPLGCYGDGGAVQTNDARLADIMRSLRIHGFGEDRYDYARVGMNARMDTLQAAILIEKLAVFPAEIEARNRIANRYGEGLAGVAETPAVAPGSVSTWAQYTLKIPAGRRSDLQAALRADGIPTAIYYPKPLHRQAPYAGYPVQGNGLPVSDQVADQVISLPMHAYLAEDVQDRIVEAVRAALV